MEESEEYNNLIKPLRICCSIVGCWPIADEVDNIQSQKLRLYNLWRYTLTTLLTIHVLGDTAEIIFFWGEDMNETIECCLVTSAFYMSVLRMVIFITHRKEMVYVIKTIKRDWDVFNDPNDLDLLKSNSLIAYKISKFFIYNVLFAGSAFIIMPALEVYLHDDAHKFLPFRGHYFFNYTSSPLVYKCTYVVNAMIGGLGCTTITAATSFSLITTMHGAAKFTVVQKDFRALTKMDWSSNAGIGRCVRKHQESIRYAETVESVINVLALAQFIVSTGLTCFAGFQLTTMLEDQKRMTKYGSFLNAAILELFIFSFSGQTLKTNVIHVNSLRAKVTEKWKNLEISIFLNISEILFILRSEEVGDCVFESDWMGGASSSVLSLIYQRSRKACTITAGKFYDMSHESFLKVMSSSFSYFTVLLAMKDES